RARVRSSSAAASLLYPATSEWPQCWLAYGKLVPSIPEVGAVCGKAARTDLCGGHEVTRVPTAKTARFHRWSGRNGTGAGAADWESLPDRLRPPHRPRYR